MIRALAFFFGLLAAIFAVLAGLHAVADFLVPPPAAERPEAQPLAQPAVVLTLNSVPRAKGVRMGQQHQAQSVQSTQPAAYPAVGINTHFHLAVPRGYARTVREAA